MSSIPPEVNRAISMTEIRESLKSNPIYLRVCIQSEVLEGLSCWESYKRFCRKFGHDAMDYPEFEFWFMRFYNGETDLEYDRSKEPKKKSLMDLPTELMTEIAKKYLNPFDMIMLSQVSRGLQFFCDPFNPQIERIEVQMTPTSTEITFENIIIRYLPFANAYGMAKNGYKVECAYKSITVESGCYLDGVRDVLMTQFTPKTSKIYQLTVNVDSKNIEEWEKLVGKLSASLFQSKIRVREVYFEADDPIHFLPLLDLLTPGYLEWIKIFNSPDFEVPYQQLAETEQWKQAKRAVLWKSEPIKPEHFPYLYHFESFVIGVGNMTMEFLMELSDMLIASPNFKDCLIFCKLNFTADVFATAIEGLTMDNEHVLRYINHGFHVLEYQGSFDRHGRTLTIYKKHFSDLN